MVCTIPNSVPVTQTGAQFMAYLESSNNLTLTSYDESSLYETAYGDSTNYAFRFPMVRGDPIGILVASGSLRPLQMSGTGIDIVTNTALYTAYIASRVTVTGSGSTFANTFGATIAALKASGSSTGSAGASSCASGTTWNGSSCLTQCSPRTLYSSLTQTLTGAIVITGYTVIGGGGGG